MKYYTIPPSEKISSYVRFFWILENDVSSHEPYFHRTMADGCCEILFHYKGRFDELSNDEKIISSFNSGINGPTQTYNRFQIKEDFGIFGAYLYPFTLTALFGIPASEIANQMPDLETLLGQTGKDLEEKIMLAPDNNTRIQILTQFFEANLAHKQVHQPAVFSSIAHIIKTRGTVSVDTLASQCFLSTRQFERNFKDCAGFGPKLYSRIIRFQSAMFEYPRKHRTLTEIAYQCGYYDQSHFIHDFKEFSGYHPRFYFSGNNEGTSWRDA